MRDTKDTLTGELLRDIGMHRAIEHADSVHESWSEKATGFLKSFARIHQFFTSEDLREYAHGNGLEFPPDGRAWGPIMFKAAKCGIICKAGYETAKDPKVHAQVITRWKSNTF